MPVIAVITAIEVMHVTTILTAIAVSYVIQVIIANVAIQVIKGTQYHSNNKNARKNNI